MSCRTTVGWLRVRPTVTAVRYCCRVDAPWSNVDVVGSPAMPSGRFLAATTETEIGAVRVIGVCILGAMHTCGQGREDRRPWEDHLRYLDGLEDCLATVTSAQATIIAGDFNQQIPAPGAPAKVSQRLAEVFKKWQIVTDNVRSRNRDLLIDHVAISPCNATVDVIVHRVLPGD